MKIIILGGGISGLSTAFYLQKALPAARITLVEQQKRLGGWIRTELQEGFLFEKGPRGFKCSGHGQDILQLIEEAGLQHQLIACSPEAKKRYVFHQGRLHPAPGSLWQMFSSPLTRDLLPQILREAFIKKAPPADESIYHFIERRYSKEAAERLIDPLTACIYGGDIRALSVQSCFPALKEWEQQHGSLLIGGLKQAFRPRRRSGPSLATLKEGMQSLVHALADRLRGELLLGEKALSITSLDNGIAVDLENGKRLEADALISTLPIDALSSIAKMPAIATPSASIAVVNVGWNKPVLKDKGFGCVFPSRSLSPLLGIVWDSSAFPQQNSHPEQTRLTLMIGGTHYPEAAILKEKDLNIMTIELLKSHLNIDAAPDAIAFFRAKNAIPQYLVGHQKKADEWKKELIKKFPKLFPSGTPWDGVALGSCIVQSKRVTEKIVEFAKKCRAI